MTTKKKKSNYDPKAKSREEVYDEVKSKTTKELKTEYTKEEIEQMMLDLVQVNPYKNGYNQGGGKTMIVDDPEDPDRKNKIVRRKNVLQSVMRWFVMPEPKDDEELEERIIQFFITTHQTGEYPTVEKLALACGTTASTIGRIMRGEVVATPKRQALYKKAYEALHSMEADLASNFDIQPVIYMFRSKNYFDMKDRQEINYTVHDPLGQKVDQKELEKLYEDNIIDADFDEKEM